MFDLCAIAELQPQKSRNVAFATPKNNESCPSHCETAATRQSLRKLRRERIRKMLRLEPLKTMKSCPSHCETSATRQSLRKLRRRNALLGALPLSEGSANKFKGGGKKKRKKKYFKISQPNIFLIINTIKIKRKYYFNYY